MGVDINLIYSPVINLAMQQNHAPVIREMEILNNTDDIVKNIDIKISFSPAFAIEYDTHIESIAPGCSERLTALPIMLSTDFLANLTERMLGSLCLKATSGDEIVFEKLFEISVLTYNEWGGSSVLPEMLAAFCMPNHPEITRIIKRASEILGQWTDSPSLDEYQTRDPNRVKKQMAAIYSAITEENITYSTIPASFETAGQRIRLADEIISSRLGTCLDMTMLFASCLEAIGLNPIVVITKEHAFAGGWLVNDSFADSVNDDSSLLTKRIADRINEILVVETTCMNTGSKATFDNACMSANRTLNSDDFILFVDIHRARISQIRPLPLRVSGAHGYKILETPAEERSHDAPVELSATDIIIDTKTEVNKKIIWERKLLDLSLRNNLLNTRITNDTIQIISVHINELEDALADNQDFHVCSRPRDWENNQISAGIYQTINAMDPVYAIVKQELSQNRIRTYLDDEKLKKALTRLYRTSRTALEENGANTLYLALGLLKWYETPISTRPRYAPILLIPVEIIRKSAASGYVIRSRDEETMLNITLLELLRQAFKITIGGLDPLPRDKSGVDVPLIFSTIRRNIMEQKNWDVVEQAILGNFSFNKFIMWNDIHNNSDVLCQNKIVSSLMSGVVEESISRELPENGDLDELCKVGDIELPISADSSQLEAINAALSGKSFILHGPPGTGKSQTITNIIANALYRGKKVLFVAEKMAALEVVQNRLESIGLGPFCLELHSNKAKKSAALEQLKKTTEVIKKKSSKEYSSEAEHINAVRKEMNEYIKAVHRQYPVGLSLYDCISRYLSINADRKAIDLPVSRIAGITAEQVCRIELALPEFKTAVTIIGNPSRNPLNGIHLSEYSSDVEWAFERLSDLVQNCDILSADAGKAYQLISGVSHPDGFSVVEIESIAKLLEIVFSAGNIYPDIINCGDERMLEEIESISEHGQFRDNAYDSILKTYDDAILSLDTEAYDTEWRAAMAKGFLSKYFAQNKVLKMLQTYTKLGIKPDKETILPLLKTISAYQKENATLSEAASSNYVIARLLKDRRCDWHKVSDSCYKSRVISSALTMLTDNTYIAQKIRSNITALLQKGVSDNASLHKKITDLVAEIKESIVFIEGKLKATIVEEDCAEWAESIKAKCKQWMSGKNHLRSYIMYNHKKAALDRLGFPEISQQVEEGSVPCDFILDAFHKGFYKAYSEYILDQEPDLVIFHGTLFEDKIKRFRSLCKDFETLTREELFAKLASNLPALQKEASQSSEVGILQRNIRNGCRGISLRKFFDTIPDLLFRMCPCMLMSPISVAQYIDAGNQKFDLVIFDEASQMPTCEAVGAIARGKSIIVVGDPKQMPPTNFFSTNTFDEDNPNIEDLESILDDCLALSFPSKYLRWHYRSKHESLIAFSNCKYYENKLLTFPSPDDTTTKLQYQHVEGIYDRGGSRQNRAEAEAIIDEIHKRLKNPELANRSIGIVTFNSNQQSLIEDLLTELFAKNPDLEKIAMSCEEPIFVKNLENVQGDERDVILFSVGYGQDKDGKITLNFGPLNRDGGWRRLNVAVSRARYEMKVFSTLLSDQIDLKRTSAEGVSGLKAFLEYAEKGKTALRSNSIESAVPYDGFVESVAAEIRKDGYDVRTNIGCSGYRVDIGVVNPANPADYVLGILCDGYNYYSTKSARDREIVQIGILRKLGWKIWRVWSMDWWNDRSAVMEVLRSTIKAAISGALVEEEEEPLRLYSGCSSANQGGNNDDAGTLSEIIKIETSDAKDNIASTFGFLDEKKSGLSQDSFISVYTNVDVAGSSVVPYITAELDFKPVLSDNFIAGCYTETVNQYILKVVELEAPIRQNLLCKRVIKAFNISRMGNRVAGYMYLLLDRLNLKTTTDPLKTYWRYDQDPDTFGQIRFSPEREAGDIPYEEARNAACHVLEQQGAMMKDDLVREMAKMFGYSRIGDNVLFTMCMGIDKAESEGKLAEINGKLKLK